MSSRSRGRRQDAGRPAANTRRRPPWMNVGPGTLFALLVAAIFLFVVAGRTHRRHGPPTIERQVQRSAHPGAGTYPQVRFLIERKDRLSLNPGQVERVDAIQEDWEKTSAPARRALAEESRKFQAYLQQSAAKPNTSFAEIQRRGSVVSTLSGAVSESRYAAWQKVLAVLDQQQRAKAEAIRKAEAVPGRDT